jgi:hypothetical protein
VHYGSLLMREEQSMSWIPDPGMGLIRANFRVENRHSTFA